MAALDNDCLRGVRAQHGVQIFGRDCGSDRRRQVCFTESVHRVFLQKPIPAHIRQCIVCVSDYEGHVDGFVQELTLAERLYKHFL